MSDTLLTPRLHLIGTQLNAWRDNSGGVASTIKNSSGTALVAVAASSDTGAFGSSMIAMASTTNIRCVRYPGQSNWSDAAAFSVLLRIIPRWSGAPAASEQGFFYASTPWNSIAAGVYAGMDTNGKPFLGFYDQYGTAYMSNVDWATAYTGFVSGTAVDLLFTWDGTAAAASAKLYVNGTLTASANPAAGNPSTNNANIGSIVFGMSPNGGTLSNYDLNEAAVWDYALSAADITSLSGRSTFLATTAFDGSAWSALTAGQIKTGISQTQAGVSVTGTYDGSDRWTDPGVANVLLGTNYKANSLTNNETGTLTSIDPGVSNVKSGTSYEINSVLKTGTLVSLDPGIANVANGVSYEINNVPLTGTLLSTDPGVANVLLGTNYEINSVPKTGTLTTTDPGVANVLLGVNYEINSVPKTGTLNQVLNEFVSPDLIVTPSPFGGKSIIGVTQGDTALINLTVQDGNGNPVNLTGATFLTTVEGPNGVGPVQFGNLKHTIVNAALGQFQISLSTSDTASLGLGANKEVIVQVTQGTQAVTYRGVAILTVYPAVPIQ